MRLLRDGRAVQLGAGRKTGLREVRYSLAGAMLAGVLVLIAGAALAARTPSTDLSFRAVISPDSITVGDPITLTLEASGPEGAKLELPVLADSIGPFSVLSAQAPAASVKDGRVTVRQTGSLTLFRTGECRFPELALLWVRAPGETLQALSRPQTVQVRSLLKGQADLKSLHGIKNVVPLERPRWWLWAGLAVLALAAAYALWRNRDRLRRRVSILAPPAPPPLPPEVAFERGLQALYKKELPERGLVKEFYAELSLLFRRYLEDRFGFPAVEETRTEVLAAAERVPALGELERRGLDAWLLEGDLVKFAKMDRLLVQARSYAEQAHAWVKETTAAIEEAERQARMAAVASTGSAAGAGAASGSASGASAAPGSARATTIPGLMPAAPGSAPGAPAPPAAAAPGSAPGAPAPPAAAAPGSAPGGSTSAPAIHAVPAERILMSETGNGADGADGANSSGGVAEARNERDGERRS